MAADQLVAKQAGRLAGIEATAASLLQELQQAREKARSDGVASVGLQQETARLRAATSAGSMARPDPALLPCTTRACPTWPRRVFSRGS